MMRLTKHWFLHCLYCLAPFVLQAAAAHSQATPCTASFPLQSGQPLSWQGADAAYSVPLPDGRDVWIFADTLYGPDRVVVGNDPKMVHSSLGISTCKGGKWHLDYVIRHDNAGKALSYFSPSDSNHWYWPLDGFYANGNLWVTLLCIQHPAKPAHDGFDFETCGSDIAQISGLEKDPQHWDVTIHPLVPNGVKAYPSATTLVHDGYAYLFAIYENGTRPLVATRIPLAKLDAPAANLEYLTVDGTWKPGLDPAKAKEVMTHGSPELSIRYHPERKQWVAVMVDPAFFSDKILLRTAPDLIGPWTDGVVIYTIPEMQPGPKHDKNIFCYAGKEHPELEPTGNIVFTYVCNTMSPSDLTARRDIYHAQVVQQPMPAVPSQ
jgi:hypothetical protein